MVHVFPRITWRSHMCTCTRLIPWYGYRCVSRGDPSTHSNDLQSAGPSTATLDSWLIAHVDPVCRRSPAHRPLFGVHEKTVPALKSRPN
ncbi:hypothetical protein ALC62_02715 [Cyphomyrmex costatus]|uniref:Uncharacterized protein n=1 Tax=Cyphomyrmex costatus TaxID=456900 RepID=A0A195D0D3_9HYME|nr:hypothetical protein ALC62_02715 [Cyphomyrmex costatus]